MSSFVKWNPDEQGRGSDKGIEISDFQINKLMPNNLNACPSSPALIEPDESSSMREKMFCKSYRQ
jgi:hypothetical protein